MQNHMKSAEKMKTLWNYWHTLHLSLRDTPQNTALHWGNATTEPSQEIHILKGLHNHPNFLHFGLIPEVILEHELDTFQVKSNQTCNNCLWMLNSQNQILTQSPYTNRMGTGSSAPIVLLFRSTYNELHYFSTYTQADRVPLEANNLYVLIHQHTCNFWNALHGEFHSY